MTWLSGWSYRKFKHIIGITTRDQYNYQMKFILHWGSGIDGSPTVADIYLDGNVKTDFSDIMFTDADGTTPLSYWIESFVSGSTAAVWVRIPYVPAAGIGIAIIYIYCMSSEPTLLDTYIQETYIGCLVPVCNFTLA